MERQPLWALIVGVLGFAAYLNALGGEYVWDDIPQVLENPFIRDWRNLPNFFTANLATHTAFPGAGPYYRPLFLISYVFDFSIWGINPFGYHLTNVVLHALCSVFVYLIAGRVFENFISAFIAGALFALHPIHSEAVAWIAGRADLLAAFFLFLSFYFYIQVRDTRGPRSLTSSLLLFALALLSKETAIVMPLLIAAHDYCHGRETERNASSFITRGVLLFLSLAVLYFVLRSVVLGSVVVGHPDAPPLTPARIFDTWFVLLNYLQLVVLPANLKVFYHFPTKEFLSVIFIGIGMGGYVIVAATMFFLYWHDKKLFFCGVWFLVTLLPTLGPAGITIMADRYLYIPSLGLCLAFGHLFKKFERSNLRVQFAFVLVASILVVFFFLTWQRNKIWKNDLTYFTQATVDAPDLPLANNNLGKWYLERNRNKEAVSFFEKALRADPNYIFSLTNLGAAYTQMGWHKQAIATYQRAISKKPDFADAHFGLGNTYREIGQFDEAITHWKMATLAKPEHPGANNNLGNLSLLQGKYHEAVGFYSAALKGQPLNAEAHYNLAMALEKQGNWEAAIPHYRTFVALAPEEYRTEVENIKHKLESASVMNK